MELYQLISIVIIGLSLCPANAFAGDESDPVMETIRQMTAKETNDMINELNSKIFDRKGPKLGPEKTHELLLELLVLYTSIQVNTLLIPKYQIRDLAMVSQQSPDKCNVDSFNELRSMISMNLNYKSNLLPYLENCKINRIRFCQKIFDSKILEGAKSFTGNQVNDLDLLMGELDKAKEEEYQQYLESTANPQPKEAKKSKLPKMSSFVVGVINYLRIKARADNPPKDQPSKKHFDELAGLCKKVDDTMRSTTSVYLTLMSDKIVNKEIDEQVTKWVRREKDCRFLLRDVESISDDFHDAVIGQKKSFCGIFSCFGKKSR